MLNSEKKKKVLVIGTSGAVGMATRDALTDHLGIDVIAYDRPITGSPEAIQQKLHDRAAKVNTYNRLVEANGKLLDGEQARWLLKGKKELPVEQRGHVSVIDSNTHDYTAALEEGVDAIVIAAGKPRTKDMKREEVAPANTPDFAHYGRVFADFAAKKITEDPEFHLPVIINAGNPVDTMTEVLGRELHAGLAEHAKQAKDAGNQGLARLLAAEARSLNKKILGQGGVLDGARAATAIHDVTGIPLDNILSVPVLGTHNENMQVDFANVKICHDGREIGLEQYPDTIPSGAFNDITERTRKGGVRIAQDYLSQLDVDQTAVLATGIANMRMVDAIVNNKKADMPVIVYHVPGDGGRFGEKNGEGFVMGAMATLDKDGAEYQAPHARIAPLLDASESNARSEYMRVKSYIPQR